MKKILVPSFPINGTSSYPEGVQAVHESVTVEGVEYYIAAGKAAAQTGAHTYEDYEASLPAKVEATMVSAKDLILLFPDEAIAELEDFAVDKAKQKKTRGRARKILVVLSSGEQLNVASPTFKALLSWAKVLPSFSQTNIDEINSKFGV